jgi:hypothetical protein
LLDPFTATRPLTLNTATEASRAVAECRGRAAATRP